MTIKRGRKEIQLEEENNHEGELDDESLGEGASSYTRDE
jgi:hypothetical protein